MGTGGLESYTLDSNSRQSLLAAIVESSQDAIISKNTLGCITSWNRSAERILGYNETQVMGKHISMLIPEERLDEEDKIVASIRSGKLITNFKTIRKTSSGQALDVSLTISPMYDGEGRVIGASKILRDITAEVELENRLMQSNLSLQRANLYKDEFIALLGHELKTPLTSLMATIELAKTLPSRTGELLDKSLEHAKSLRQLLNELLDLAQLQSGRLEINRVTADAGSFITKAVEVVQQSSSEHMIEWEALQIAYVMADALRMEQVIINLLSNAVKYSPGKNTIIVQLRRAKEWVTISVKDFGMGIPENELEHLFTRFYRVSTHKNQIKGLGIGLHFSSQIVKAHGGKITVESRLNEGSTFTVWLPVKE